MGYNLTKVFTVTLPSGKTVSAEVESVWVHDPSYGADADDNRGMAMDFMDDLYLTTPIENGDWSTDDNEVVLTHTEKVEAEQLLLHMAEFDPWDEMREVSDY